MKGEFTANLGFFSIHLTKCSQKRQELGQDPEKAPIMVHTWGKGTAATVGNAKPFSSIPHVEQILKPLHCCS